MIQERVAVGAAINSADNDTIVRTKSIVNYVENNSTSFQDEFLFYDIHSLTVPKKIV
jgi:hypothetical protein